MPERKITDARTITFGETTYLIKRQFGTRPLNDLILEHMMNEKKKHLEFD